MLQPDHDDAADPRLAAPADVAAFRFPYTPYTIQADFMRNLYEAIEHRRIGIFESPTGTGKTLSLICGALTWLADHNRRLELNQQFLKEKISAANSAGDPDWVIFQELESQIAEQKRQQAEVQVRRAERRAKVEAWESARRAKRRRPAPQQSETNSPTAADQDDDLLVDPYASDTESTLVGEDGYTAAVRHYDQSLQAARSRSGADDPETFGGGDKVTRIYFTSRTHSQLAQMVHEVRKTAYADGIRITSLGSRRTLCIHDPVRQLKSMQRINETCLDLQKKGLAANRRCPHYPAEPRQLLEFQDHALASIHDIEELVTVGRELGICPYYGTRASLPEVELVTLPYNLLLQKSAREALGINLKDAVVIVDEAHNLVDTITQIHSAILTLDQVNRAASQLTAYLQKYKSRLKGSNAIYIRQVLHLLAALRKFLGSGGRGLIDLNPAGGDTAAAVATATSHLLKPNELLGQLQIDNVNLFKVQKYLIESQIGKKLNMFIDRRREQEAKGGAPLSRPTGSPDLKRTEAGGDETEEWASQRSTLPLVESFLMCLTHTDQDGRVILSLTPATPTSVPQPHLKYVLLNPHESFQVIADEARSVILAGGTMEPVDELLALLCRDTPANHIHRFNCGHVVPATSLLALTVDKGPTGRPFKFLADARGDAALTQELGQTLLNLCNIIPNGLVCFFPSYAYLHQVHAEWQRSGMLNRLHRKKAIFTEPQTSTEVEAMLAQYSSAAMGKATTGNNGDDARDKKSEQANGALLLSVVGGKMSEGINFGDELGRGVVMVGLPFANLGSLELQEKIRFVAAEPGTGTTPSQTESLATVHVPCPDIHTVLQTPKAKLYYENLCMKAVNQSIGRAIRHRGDYAVIVMLDQRFNTPRIYTKLPTWIGQRRVACPTFGPMMAQIARFFRERSAPHAQPM